MAVCFGCGCEIPEGASGDFCRDCALFESAPVSWHDSPPSGVSAQLVQPTQRAGYREPAKAPVLLVRRSWRPIHHPVLGVLGPLAWVSVWSAGCAFFVMENNTSYIVWSALLAGAGLIAAGYRWLNTSTVRVDGHAISVTHRPLPWFSPAPVPRDRLQYLEAEEIIRDGGPNRANSTWYRLSATIESGQTTVLLDRVPTMAQARWIKDRVDAHLGGGA